MTGIVAQNVGRASGLIKAASGGGGVWTLIKTLTSDGSDATMSFVDGTSDVVLDSTYPIYKFVFINIHPETDSVQFLFQGNAAGGSGYNETITSTAFFQHHREDDSATSLDYRGDDDQAQGSAFQYLAQGVGNDNDQALSGYLHLFAPADTTFITHFTATTNYVHASHRSYNHYVQGYFNTTSAIDDILFKFSAEEIQGGKSKLYGLSDS